jgi:uncharacterized cupin superfamily protein
MTDKAARTSSADAEGTFTPFNKDEAPWEEFSHDTPTRHFGSRFKRLGAFGGGSHVGVIYEELRPGAQTCPEHYHMLEEEHVFILEGSLTLLLGGKEYPMQAGDHVCFPAGQKAGHALVNRGTAPCRYILIGEDNRNEVVVYPASGRVGVRLTGEGYSKAAAMEYWEGEK